MICGAPFRKSPTNVGSGLVENNGSSGSAGKSGTGRKYRSTMKIVVQGDNSGTG